MERTIIYYGGTNTEAIGGFRIRPNCGVCLHSDEPSGLYENLKILDQIIWLRNVRKKNTDFTHLRHFHC